MIGRDNPEFQDRNKYILLHDENKIVAYSSKVASTATHARYRKHRTYLFQEHVLEHRNAGCPIELHIREPLDRLVSAWKYFAGTGRRRSYIQRQFRLDHDVLTQIEGVNFNDWVRVALKHWDEHWCSQTAFHTYKGVFLPTRVIDVSYFGGEKHNTTTHSGWREYISPELANLLSSIYAEDMRLFEQARGKPQGISTGATHE